MTPPHNLRNHQHHQNGAHPPELPDAQRQRCMICLDRTVAAQFELDAERILTPGDRDLAPRVLTLCATCHRLLLSLMADVLGTYGWSGPRPWEEGMRKPRRPTAGRAVSLPADRSGTGQDAINLLTVYITSMLARYLDSAPEARAVLPASYCVYENDNTAQVRVRLLSGETVEISTRYLGLTSHPGGQE